MNILADENYLWLVRPQHKRKFQISGHTISGVGDQGCPPRGSSDHFILEWLLKQDHIIITQDFDDFSAINNERVIILGLPPGKNPFTHRSDLILNCIGRLSQTFDGECNVPPGLYFLPNYNY